MLKLQRHWSLCVNFLPIYRLGESVNMSVSYRPIMAFIAFGIFAHTVLGVNPVVDEHSILELLLVPPKNPFPQVLDNSHLPASSSSGSSGIAQASRKISSGTESLPGTHRLSCRNR